MDEFIEKNAETNQELKCKECAAILKFQPGTKSLVCEYCGANNVIEASTETIQEINFEEFIANQASKEERIEVVTVKCTSCGASSTLKPNVTSDQCPFCGVSLVVSSGSTSSLLKPKSLLPFKVDQKAAMEAFRKWIKGLWFAPSALKKYALSTDKLAGMYIPYWTYDSDTTTFYTGARGTYYYVTESYTTTENGQTVTKTRQVRKTRWTPASGYINKFFDDVLVLASKSLPEQYTSKLEPWDLNNLEPFNDKYLSGFKTESYQIDVKEGFGKAKVIMDDHIRTLIKQDIGGDEQRIYTVSTNYKNITFKHILLPIWLSAYRYSNKVYRFLVNGRTAEVQGERPYSWIKITLFILMLIGIGVGIYFLLR